MKRLLLHPIFIHVFAFIFNDIDVEAISAQGFSLKINRPEITEVVFIMAVL
jgi:hypothetical protein